MRKQGFRDPYRDKAALCHVASAVSILGQNLGVGHGIGLHSVTKAEQLTRLGRGRDVRCLQIGQELCNKRLLLLPLHECQSRNWPGAGDVPTCRLVGAWGVAQHNKW